MDGATEDEVTELDEIIGEFVTEKEDELSEGGEHKHPTRPPWSEGMTWVYCPTCVEFVHEPCGGKSCRCEGGSRR